MTVRGILTFLSAGLLPLLAPLSAAACAVCGLDSSADPMGRGLSDGVIFLMAMPFTIAGAIGAGVVYMHRRILKRQKFEIRNANLEHVPHKEMTP